MRSISEKDITKCLDVVYFVILLSIPFINILRGLDYTDTGYSLMCFQNFLDARGDWSLCMYFSNFFGWILLHLPGSSTLVGMKCYCTLLLSAMNILVYFFFVVDVLKKKATIIQRTLVFLGISLATMLNWCPRVVLYNYLSYFLAIVTLVLLYKGLEKENGRYLLIAGLVLAVSAFVKFPNILQVLFIIPVIVYDFLAKKKAFAILKDFYTCLVGYLSGFVILLAVSMFTHGYDAYVNMISSLFSLSQAGNGYAGEDLLSTYPRVIRVYGKWIAIFFLIVIFLWLASKFERKALSKFVTTLLGIIAFGLLLRAMHYWGIISIRNYTSWSSVDFFALSFVFGTMFVCVLKFYQKNADVEDKFLATFVLVYILILPLGTNTQYIGVLNAMFVVIPYLLISVEKQLCVEKYKKYISITVVMVIFLLISTFQFFMFYNTRVYGDMTSSELTSKESHIPSLKNEKLLPGMVGIIDGLYDYLKEENLLDTPLLTWGDIPSVCFYMGAPSALSNAWPDLTSYREEDFLTELDAINPSPIIINRWFSGGDPLDEAVWQYSAKAKDLAMYMELHGYSLTFENDKFRVYLPEK